MNKKKYLNQILFKLANSNCGSGNPSVIMNYVNFYLSIPNLSDEIGILSVDRGSFFLLFNKSILKFSKSFLYELIIMFSRVLKLKLPGTKLSRAIPIKQKKSEV